MLRLKNICTKITAFVMITVFVSVCCKGEVHASQPQKLWYLAVGDSIANGYSCDDKEISPYPELVRRQYEREKGMPVELTNIAKNGLSTERFNASKLGEQEVSECIRTADIITVTIGANDLIDAFKTACQDVLGREERFWNMSDALEMLHTEMKAHPTLVLKAVAVIADWDYDAFEENYCTMMDGIIREAKPSVRVIVTDIYNPTAGLGMPGTLGMVVDSVIGKMNSIIREHATEYGYRVVGLEEAGITSHIQKDGLHPTEEGQQLIADAVLKELELMEQDPKGIQESGTAVERDAHAGIWNIMALSGMAVTGILLVILGVWKGKRREKEDENITDSN